MFSVFYRGGSSTAVQVDVDSKLNVKASIFPLMFNCGNEAYAELLMNRLNKMMDIFKKKIAKDAICYLNANEISALKSKLTKWDSRKNCWK